jgi:formamidopyrimidine-DNA glycosylase
MPELPELEVIADRLTDVLAGETIDDVAVYNHLVIHGETADQFTEKARGRSFLAFRADGKFLIMSLSDSLEIVINPMLTGRFRILGGQKPKTKSDVFSLLTHKGVLRYADQKSMSRVYIVRVDEESKVAGFQGRGPSALDSALTFEVFRTRVPRFQGQIKNVLENQRFVKGIGNAYADEILLYAGILPFRKRSSLNAAEIEQLYNAMKGVLGRYREMLSDRNLEDLGPEKRDFLMIHNKGGGICPLCGGRISEVTANRFKTNYCQRCQK